MEYFKVFHGLEFIREFEISVLQALLFPCFECFELFRRQPILPISHLALPHEFRCFHFLIFGLSTKLQGKEVSWNYFRLLTLRLYCTSTVSALLTALLVFILSNERWFSKASIFSLSLTVSSFPKNAASRDTTDLRSLFISS